MSDSLTSQLTHHDRYVSLLLPIISAVQITTGIRIAFEFGSQLDNILFFGSTLLFATALYALSYFHIEHVKDYKDLLQELREMWGIVADNPKAKAGFLIHLKKIEWDKQAPIQIILIISTKNMLMRSTRLSNTLLILGSLLAAILWFIFPSNSRLEPLTFLLGLYSALMVYITNQIYKTSDEEITDLVSKPPYIDENGQLIDMEMIIKEEFDSHNKKEREFLLVNILLAILFLSSNLFTLYQASQNSDPVDPIYEVETIVITPTPLTQSQELITLEESTPELTPEEASTQIDNPNND